MCNWSESILDLDQGRLEKVMGKQIEIRPEMARLAQLRARATGQSVAQELARSVVEESIYELDPELNLLVDFGDSLSQHDGLVRAVGVNDIVVNGRRIDVRALDKEGTVSVAKALVGTPYLSSGTLVVVMNGTDSGEVVGYISSGMWLAAEEQAKNSDVVQVQPKENGSFSIGTAVHDICQKPQVNLNSAASTPEKSDLSKFLTNRHQFIMARQKQIVTAICNNVQVRDEIATDAGDSMSTQTMRRILVDTSIWSARVERLVNKVAPKFPALSREEIKSHVRNLGEQWGGQPDAPEFRKSLLDKLTRAQLARQYQGATASKVANVVEQVLAGGSALDAVKSFVKNKVAVDLAAEIKRQRNRVEGFVAATAEEIGSAFQQLALQPAYATHSQSPDSGVESINEALQLLEAGDLAEQVKELDNELAQL